MDERNGHIGLIGGGLTGCMTALLLNDLGYRVSIFEKRDELRITEDDKEVTDAHGRAGHVEKRSINMALSYRGQVALRLVGIEEKVLSESVPMPKRVIHKRDGSITTQPYGKKDQCIFSISRNYMNSLLVEEVLKREGITLDYRHHLESLSSDGTVVFQTPEGRREETFDLVIGADGAFSTVREQMIKLGRYDISRHFVRHGYKELNIPPRKDGEWALDEEEGLHIWPRGDFMLIALPNPDKTFTATLFAPFEGRGGFDTVNVEDEEEILSYFHEHFPDVVDLMPNVVEDYRENPVGSLGTIRVTPWHYESKIMVIGDAAHALVPFYGQGMNCGFEDATRLYESVKEHGLEEGIARFCEDRVAKANALSDLSYANYTEMASHTDSSLFLFQKWVESILHGLFPSSWIPLYTMVAFTDIPYDEAMARARRQDLILKRVGISSLVLLASLLGVGLTTLMGKRGGGWTEGLNRVVSSLSGLFSK
jgi:kynurenine 3-monooxygenase